MAAAVLNSVTRLDAAQRTADAAVNAPLTGTQKFQAARRPDFTVDQPFNLNLVDLEIVSGPQAGEDGQHYRVRWPVNACRDGWYVRVIDASSAATNALFVWMTASDLLPFTRIGHYLADTILWPNKPMIDHLLQAVDVREELKSVRYDVEWNKDERGAAIMVKPLSDSETWQELMARDCKVAYSLEGEIRRIDANFDAELIGQFAEAVKVLLNQSAYFTVNIDDDLAIANAMTEGFQIYDEFIDSIWISRWSTVWSAEYIRKTA